MPELPDGIRSRRIGNVNGLDMHLLTAGDPDDPLVLLLHGFPELAYSWRRVMPALALGGYFVVAPDQRGYGQTLGWDDDYDGDLESFRLLNLAEDAACLVAALDRTHAHAVVGHDFGSPVAAWCALAHPDTFSRVALMSAPFAGIPAASDKSTPAAPRDLQAALAELDPPRKHYQQYYSERSTNQELMQAPQGITSLLRAYYHVKSADWAGNRPRPLAAADAQALSELPTYYLMNAGETMAETVAPHMPDSGQECSWLSDDELAVYVAEFQRTGFQGGLNWYRAAGLNRRDQQSFAGQTINQPSLFVSGASDWGTYQTPGAFEAMQQRALGQLTGVHLVAGAGHWVQQEQPDAVIRLLRDFLATA